MHKRVSAAFILMLFGLGIVSMPVQAWVPSASTTFASLPSYIAAGMLVACGIAITRIVACLKAIIGNARKKRGLSLQIASAITRVAGSMSRITIFKVGSISHQLNDKSGVLYGT